MRIWHDVARLAALSALLPQIVEAARWDEEGNAAYSAMVLGSLDDEGYACDGHGALLVTGAPAHAPHKRDRGLRAVLDETRPRGAVVGSACIREATTGDRCRIGDTLLSSYLVRRWVMGAAEIDGGPVWISYNAPRDSVLFLGTGWRAVVMPRTAEEGELSRTRPLVSVAGSEIDWCTL